MHVLVGDGENAVKREEPSFISLLLLSDSDNQARARRVLKPRQSISRWNIRFCIYPPRPKLIIQEGEKMGLIFQGGVQWTVVMWLIPLSETLPRELMQRASGRTTTRRMCGARAERGRVKRKHPSPLSPRSTNRVLRPWRRPHSGGCVISFAGDTFNT